MHFCPRSGRFGKGDFKHAQLMPVAFIDQKERNIKVFSSY